MKFFFLLLTLDIVLSKAEDEVEKKASAKKLHVVTMALQQW
jgi:hypothetical protein